MNKEFVYRTEGDEGNKNFEEMDFKFPPLSSASRAQM